MTFVGHKETNETHRGRRRKGPGYRNSILEWNIMMNTGDGGGSPQFYSF